MSVYLVMAIDVKDSKMYEKYIEGAGKALSPFKLKRISTDSMPVIYEGIQPASKLSIIEFESEEKFDEFYKSDAYQNIIKFRHEASETKFIMLMKASE